MKIDNGIVYTILELIKISFEDNEKKLRCEGNCR